MKVIYQTDLRHDPQPQGRPNHGARWTPEDYEKLRRLWFDTKEPFSNVCNAMGRSWSAVIAKLSEQGWVKYDDSLSGYTYCRNNATEVNEFESATTKENTMTANIETKTFIAGIDASTMDDTQVFQHIAKLEREIDKLVGIRTKSTKLAAAIKALEKDVADLAAYVDAR